MSATPLTVGHVVPAPRGRFWRTARQAIASTLAVDLTHTQKHYARVLDRYVCRGVRWLEIGCGRQVLPDWAMAPDKQGELVSRARFLTGIDVDAALYEHPRLTYRVAAVGNAMPFHAGSFDLVTANMVVEHVDDPVQFLSEIRRILRPGGRFIFHTTNVSNWVIFCARLVPDGLKKRLVWYFEHREAKDVFPTWYRMNTVSRIEKTVARSGFKINEFQVNGTAGILESLGPLGWVEVLLMKAAATIRNGRYNSNIICVLQRD